MFGKTQMIASATQIRRLKSTKEARAIDSTRKRKKGASASSFNNQSEDFVRANPVKSQQRACEICSKSGHGTLTCPKTTKHGTPSQRGNRDARADLAQTLSTATNHVWCHLKKNNPPTPCGDVQKKMYLQSCCI